MEQSVLTSIKNALGLAEDYHVYDDELVMHINSVFSILHNIGGTPKEGFSITGPNQVWGDFLVEQNQTNMIRTYVFLKVRMIFDPPSTSFTQTAVQEQIKELEFRIQTTEILFNPDIYSYLQAGDPESIVWTVQTDGTFPEEAPVGAMGVDSLGNVWRKE